MSSPPWDTYMPVIGVACPPNPLSTDLSFPARQDSLDKREPFAGVWVPNNQDRAQAAAVSHGGAIRER